MPQGEYIQMETKCIIELIKWVNGLVLPGVRVLNVEGQKSEMEWGKQGRAYGVELELEVSISIHDIIKIKKKCFEF